MEIAVKRGATTERVKLTTDTMRAKVIGQSITITLGIISVLTVSIVIPPVGSYHTISRMASALPDHRDFSRSRRSVTDYSTGNDTSDRDIMVSKDMWGTVYQYVEFKEKYPQTKPTVCFNKNGFNDSGTMFFNFTCPMLNQGLEYSKCCGPSDEQTCCKEQVDDKKAKIDIIAGVTGTILFLLAILMCLILYRCCCQKRPELHSGKLIWIKQNKKTTIYEEGGVSPGGSVADPDEEDVELVGFIQVPENHNASHSPLGSRKSIEVAIAEAEKQSREKEKEKHKKEHDRGHHHGDHHHHHHHKDHHHGDKHHHKEDIYRHKEDVHKDDKIGDPPESNATPQEDLNIPSINILPSTPEPELIDEDMDNAVNDRT